MNFFDNDDINAILATGTIEVVRNYAWIILINGKRFKTSKGKSVWKEKNHASNAFNFEFGGEIRKEAKKKLTLEGIEDYYRDDRYKEAVTIFKKEAIESGILEFKQLVL